MNAVLENCHVNVLQLIIFWSWKQYPIIYIKLKMSGSQIPISQYRVHQIIMSGMKQIT